MSAKEDLTAEDVAGLKVADLKTELSTRGLSTKGLKKELADRLLAFLAENTQSTEAGADPTAQDAGDGPELAAQTTQETENLPSELPTDPPVSADLVQDEDAAVPADTNGHSEVERTVDEQSKEAADGTNDVASSSLPTASEDTEAAPAMSRRPSEKRKRDEAEDDNENHPVPPAVQEETAAMPNDPIQPAPIDTVEEPETKRIRTEDVDMAIEQEVQQHEKKHIGQKDGQKDGQKPAESGQRPPESYPESKPDNGPSQKPPSRSINIRGTALQEERDETSGRATLSAEDRSQRERSTSSRPLAFSDAPPASASVCVSNLVRPFTVPALREKLDSFGDVDYFWINNIKSHCYVTYAKATYAQELRDNLAGQVWPEAVGKALGITFLPSEHIERLVQKEEQAGRTRLELVVSRTAEGEWEYDVAAPAPMGPAQPRNSMLGTAPPTGPAVVDSRGLPRGPSRQDERSGGMRSDTIRNGDNSFSSNVWQPAKGTEGYKTTRTEPSLYYRPVDTMAAGRRLRDLEQERRRGGGGVGGGWSREPYRRRY